MTRLIARGINAVLLVALLSASVLWVWSGHNTSLDFVLRHMPSVFAQAKALSATDVHASIRTGGRIGELRWTTGDLRIRAVDVSLSYDLNSLLKRRLGDVVLTIGQLHIDDKSAKGSPAEPAAELMLPLPVDMRLEIKEFFWQGGTSAALSHLALDYAFDGQKHRIDSGQVQVAAGKYDFQAELGAQRPLAIKASAKGQWRVPIPGSKETQTLRAIASVDGELHQPDSNLRLKVDLERIDLDSRVSQSNPAGQTQLRLMATLAPWQVQPLARVSANWSELDLAVLWPQAPVTRLSGQAAIKPTSVSDQNAWAARIELLNQRLGPIDQRGLPLSRLQTSLVYQNAGWQVQDLQAEIAGGTLQAKGRYASKGWQFEGFASQIQPGQLDTRLTGSAVNAQMKAQQTESGLAFESGVNVAESNGIRWTSWPLNLQSLQASGLWQSPSLKFDTFNIKTSEARLQASGSYNHQSQEVDGRLVLEIPGLNANMAGKAGRDQGQGTLELRADKLEKSTAWLERWPPLKAMLTQGAIQGDLAMNGSWQGGWKDLGRDLRFDLGLKATGLQWRQAAAAGAETTVLHLQKVQAKASGRPNDFALQSSGDAVLGLQRLRWSTQAGVQQTDAKTWQAQVGQLSLGWQKSNQAPVWSLALDAAGQSARDPLTVRWTSNDGLSNWHLAPGQASINGPLPGAVSLRWEASTASAQANGQVRWQTRGSVPRLPLSWIEALSPKSFTELGLSSDLVLQARWEAAHDQSLHLQALLERNSGDLRINTNDARQPIVAAELSELRLQLDLNERQVASSLRWNSARAGRALVAVSTTLGDPRGPWQWPDDAPVAAGIQLQSPPAQAWSAFAPPGWRLQGVVDADVTLAGTRANPIWRGQLRARDLAVRSLVQGLDLDRGELKANLDGQTLRIESASIKGAGASGGSVDLAGSMSWITDSKVRELASHLRMDLKAKLNAMRVSLRPDRRISASGELSAGFNGKELSLTGSVEADHALITLPDDDTPALGEDVVVRRASNQTTASLVRPAPTAAVLPFPFRLNVDLDPGGDFQIRGRGLRARLSGKLNLTSTGPGATRLTGAVGTVGGVYQALGQRLDIEKGTMRFAGAIDNPGLDILAIRPQISQRVGVQIGGNALAPAVRLYADPDLPEAEKLSWLLLGRSSGGSGGEAALLQQATLAMISSRRKEPTTTLAQSFGLDELGISGKSSTAGGEIDSASLTLGKRLSKDLYVAYEHSLAGTVGAFSVFYDLSSRVTVRAQAGEKSAIDLIYTLRYD